MTAYLINSALCSALLLVVYHLLLKNKAMYVFNRFYLLGSIIFSLIIPLIIIENPMPVVTPVQQVQHYIESQAPDIMYVPVPVLQQAETAQAPSYYATIPWYVYLYVIVTCIFLFRYAMNLYFISRKIKENELADYKSSKLVLLSEKLVPHTFLNYIFLNKEEFEAKRLEDHIMRHEMAHAKQLHSVDIMLVEFIQSFYWLNPLIIFYGKAIRLNHEFIADAEVLQRDVNVSEYQYLLVSKLSEAHGLNMTSQLNYSVTKKRFKMMTRKTPHRMVWISSLAIVPVLIFAFLSFSNMTEVKQKISAAMHRKIQNKPVKTVFEKLPPPVKFPPPVVLYNFPFSETPASQEVLDKYRAFVKKYGLPEYYKGQNRLIVDAADKIQMEQLYKQMSKAQQRQQKIVFGNYTMNPLPLLIPTEEKFESWKDPAIYGVWIDGKHIRNEELRNYKASDFKHYSKSNLHYTAKNIENVMKAFNLSVMYKYQLDLMTADYYEKNNADIIAKQGKSEMYYYNINNTPTSQGLYLFREK